MVMITHGHAFHIPTVSELVSLELADMKAGEGKGKSWSAHGLQSYRLVKREHILACCHCRGSSSASSFLYSFQLCNNVIIFSKDAIAYHLVITNLLYVVHVACHFWTLKSIAWFFFFFFRMQNIKLQETLCFLWERCQRAIICWTMLIFYNLSFLSFNHTKRTRRTDIQICNI